MKSCGHFGKACFEGGWYLLIFVDTEFTDLKSDKPALLSIGMITGDGQHEFYAEIPEGDGWTRSDCADFTIDEVLPLMWGREYEVPAAELPQRIRTWLESLSGVHQIAADNQVEIRFLDQLLGKGWPANLKDEWIHIGNMVGSPAFTKATEAYYNLHEDGKQHHALVDARANRVGWLAWAGPYEDRLSVPGEIMKGFSVESK